MVVSFTVKCFGFVDIVAVPTIPMSCARGFLTFYSTYIRLNRIESIVVGLGTIFLRNERTGIEALLTSFCFCVRPRVLVFLFFSAAGGLCIDLVYNVPEVEDCMVIRPP